MKRIPRRILYLCVVYRFYLLFIYGSPVHVNASGNDSRCCRFPFIGACMRMHSRKNDDIVRRRFGFCTQWSDVSLPFAVCHHYSHSTFACTYFLCHILHAVQICTRSSYIRHRQQVPNGHISFPLSSFLCSHWCSATIAHPYISVEQTICSMLVYL